MQTFCLLRQLQILLLWQANRCRPLACSSPAWLWGSSPGSAAGSSQSSSSNPEKECPPRAEPGKQREAACSPCSLCDSHVGLLGHTQVANALKVVSMPAFCALPSGASWWLGSPSPGQCETLRGSHFHHFAIVGPPGPLRFAVTEVPKHTQDIGIWTVGKPWRVGQKKKKKV